MRGRGGTARGGTPGLAGRATGVLVSWGVRLLGFGKVSEVHAGGAGFLILASRDLPPSFPLSHNLSKPVPASIP